MARNQVTGNRVSLDSIVKAPAFRQGVNHYRTGTAPIFDEPWQVAGRGRQNTMWSYERGRLFAAYAKGCGLDIDERAFFNARRLDWRISKLAHDAFYAGVFD